MEYCLLWINNGIKTKDWLRRGDIRREFKKRDKGMKGHVDKSMGIVTHTTEVLTRIKPTEPIRFFFKIYSIIMNQQSEN